MPPHGEKDGRDYQREGDNGLGFDFMAKGERA